MQVPEEARKCVAFVGFRNHDGLYEVGGTAFFVSRSVHELKSSFTYVITAKHVIDKIRDRLADRVCLRLIFKDGNARWIETDISEWHFHPDDSEVDVALLRWGFPFESDHLYLETNMLLTNEKVEKFEIGNGDDVVITGLFASHYGLQKNIPIVRVGNIAAMPEEYVQVPGWGLIEAYLIEARSTGGISGSPVFVNLGLHRMMKGQFMQTIQGPIFYLLGLVHGHWNANSSSNHTDTDHAPSAEKVNMGIAIVVPASKIIEVINQPTVKRLDNEEERQLRSQLKQPLPVQ